MRQLLHMALRMCDLKTDKYASLIGGKYFKPKQENPFEGRSITPSRSQLRGK